MKKEHWSDGVVYNCLALQALVENDQQMKRLPIRALAQLMNLKRDLVFCFAFIDHKRYEKAMKLLEKSKKS